MGGLVAGQNAGVARAVIGNRNAIVLAHYVGVKIHQSFARNVRRNRAHAVCSMTDRTGEPVLRYVIAVLQEAGVADHVAQIMTLGAHAIGSVEAEIRIRSEEHTSELQSL